MYENGNGESAVYAKFLLNGFRGYKSDDNFDDLIVVDQE